MHALLILSALFAVIRSADAWGAGGHEIVATIAQVHLHPAVKDKLCTILPAQAKCHLAPVAAWADTVRGRYRETGPMHYINPVDDVPGEHCTFGEHGWINDKVNVITAIGNTTKILMDPHKTARQCDIPTKGWTMDRFLFNEGDLGARYTVPSSPKTVIGRPRIAMNKMLTLPPALLSSIAEKDIALRFLIHFVGDMHQPLHLTGRMRGGNDAIFNFEGRRRSLHSVWDSGIITKNIRELGNYTAPTRRSVLHLPCSPPHVLTNPQTPPSMQTLTANNSNPHSSDPRSIRTTWLDCPAQGDPYPPNRGSPPRVAAAVWATGLPQPVRKLVQGLASTWGWWNTDSTVDIEGFDTQTVKLARLAQNWNIESSSATAADVRDEDANFPACPYTWAKPLHTINCDYAWPHGWDPRLPVVELDTPEYLGKIGDHKVVEQLLAQGGIRLAAILNSVFLDEQGGDGVRGRPWFGE
ncbi:hypothetical protein QFC19_008962 [Naganishia cerealis]|uniref:Uncharacterized protein n=1 Tax=Naganishia cerealis TaxID=610337 RepID=A0ACC2UY86_9TREE|nr:hypothetical protein QFC19_008962 [Naganishia cerealis]